MNADCSLQKIIFDRPTQFPSNMYSSAWWIFYRWLAGVYYLCFFCVNYYQFNMNCFILIKLLQYLNRVTSNKVINVWILPVSSHLVCSEPVEQAHSIRALCNYKNLILVQGVPLYAPFIFFSATYPSSTGFLWVFCFIPLTYTQKWLSLY